MILHAHLREHNTKGDTHKLRRTGHVPANLYGRDINNMLVEFGELELCSVLKKVGEHGIVDVDVDGKNYKAMIKEVQKDPVSQKVLHIDLYKVNEKEKVHARVPIVIKGEEYLRNMNAVIQKVQDEVEVECSVDKVPKYLAVDITNLNKDKITVADLEVSEEISIIAPPNMLLATLVKAGETVREAEEVEKEIVVFADGSIE
ncbi:MAG: 50S ribosomal protein L25 [Caloramator sp.]|nr:50S ribosomal protein L25 [Caloramator sp.]